MQFKIKNTDYKISFSFFALILLMITVNKTLFSLFIFVFIHELIHLLFINLFSVAPKKVSFTLFGANILRDFKSAKNNNSEIVINLSAPIFNIFIYVACYIFSFYFPQFTKQLLGISEINLSIGLFNLIPFYNFDGGNALRCFLLKYADEKTTELILTITSVIVTIIFSFVSVYVIIYYRYNISLVFISLYMIISIIFKK